PLLNSQVIEFGEEGATLTHSEPGKEGGREIPYNHAFVLIGADIPRQFLKSLGLRMENEWEGNLASASLLTILGFLGLWFFGGYASFAGKSLSFVPPWAGLSLWAIALIKLIILGRKGDRF